MATGNPAIGMMLAKLAAMKRGGGGPAMPGGGPAGPPQPNTGDQLGSQFAELKGADPEMMTKALTAMKGQLVSIYGRAAFTAPEVSQHIANAQKYIDKAIEAARKAATTLNTINPPIANNAAMPNPAAVAGGGIGGPGGM